MPSKGETSRPLNRTQRQAAKSLLMLNREMQNKSLANKLEIISGPRYVTAAAKLRDAHKSEYTRKTMKKLAREAGASKATQSVRAAVRSRSSGMKTETLKTINKRT